MPFLPGVTVYKPQERIDEMIQRADQALYNAKKAERDCVKTNLRLISFNLFY
ncbi:MAG: diguanylate cyclase [Desulfobacteraceae bacterium]|nr:diguanylate cyclase [Desulfobacteraceae bacterium]